MQQLRGIAEIADQLGAAWLVRSVIATAVKRFGETRVAAVLHDAAQWVSDQTPEQLSEQLKSIDPNQ